MEAICKILGMCLAFVPSIYFAAYMIKRASGEQKFDLHVTRVKDKAGYLGVVIAILNRLLLFILLTCLGLYITSYFSDNWSLDIVIVSLILYIISYFIDNKNDI